MYFSTFFVSVAFVFGATSVAEQQQIKCTGWNMTIIGQYAFPIFTNATHCYDGTVRCLGDGYEQCSNNKFIPKQCECEDYRCRKTGQFLQCEPKVFP
ncbi:hypothetical protein DSO57_1014104 [Entomophthora muscae]|uniref:Uncharacterized protein n=1 Tax=Entomophthora muscae TaxID=34485 RepID=A0ACC2UQB7_9FUNG|nr:hypothetical protein DSO57_1014104 [Entomophthora muscae]